MVYRTGYVLIQSDSEHYIQVETELTFYRQKFVSTGKYLLFEDEDFIGDFVIQERNWACTGMSRFSNEEKDEILAFIKTIKVHPKNCSSSFGFGLQLDDNIIYCEIIVKHNVYEIWFDGVSVAKIYQDEQYNWLQVLGKPLPVAAINDIAKRIENHYS